MYSFPQAESLDGALCVPDIKLHSNPSAFNVYCNVRHCVLDWQQREASLALASRSSVQSGDSDSEEEEEYREPAVKLPKVRAAGPGLKARARLCPFSFLVFLSTLYLPGPVCRTHCSRFT